MLSEPPYKTPESNLEPFDPNGPLTFTSGAMLSFAYIRNCFLSGDERVRESHSWDPVSIADRLRAMPAGKRSGANNSPLNTPSTQWAY
ncbi:hypothetical protein IFM47457_02137 [Aspergillus lentulus]|nr:hypothetical protein IFM47457_02137 [Aspergillus lentulus]